MVSTILIQCDKCSEIDELNSNDADIDVGNHMTRNCVMFPECDSNTSTIVEVVHSV